jgi:putative DNA methylase
MDLTKKGTKSKGKKSGFNCLLSGVPIKFDYIRKEASSGRMSERLMAIVAEGKRGRIYLSPTKEMETITLAAKPTWLPNSETYGKCRVNIGLYGMTTWDKLFTLRQLTSLTTLSDLVQDVQKKVLLDSGNDSQEYAKAIATYMACLIDRMAYYGSTLTTWLPKDSALRDCMPRQALAMTWDFAEGNPFGKSSGDIITCSKVIANYLENATPFKFAIISQKDAQKIDDVDTKYIFSTDPPYYDNISYADLSDYFYVWLRHSLKNIYPSLFATMAVPKAEELVATPYRHGGKEQAEAFFMNGMTQAMHRLAEQAHENYPVTIYYAFKQSETEIEGTASTGWETFLEALIDAGFSINGTWPMRTEGAGRMIAKGTNSLASSIILVCRPLMPDAQIVTRREFINEIKQELPNALRHLQHSNIAPVDLAQAAIGPGMAVFTRYSKVIDVEGNAMTVREALALINHILDEVLAEQEGDFDSDSRWALSWFEQFGFEEGEYGMAETLSKAKNTSVSGMVEAGILKTKTGKVRLLKPNELPEDWDPATDERLTVWEMVHHLIHVLEAGGEIAAAELVARLGSKADVARELAYRLYTQCERKKRAQEALAYNSLVQSWPEIVRLAKDEIKLPKGQTTLTDE